MPLPSWMDTPAGREAAARACSVAAYGAYCAGERLEQSARWIVAQGDNLLEHGRGCRQRVCGACLAELTQPHPVSSGFGFCTPECFQRAVYRKCSRCSARIVLIYVAARDLFAATCTCGQTHAWTPTPLSTIPQPKELQ